MGLGAWGTATWVEGATGLIGGRECRGTGRPGPRTGWPGTKALVVGEKVWVSRKGGSGGGGASGLGGQRGHDVAEWKGDGGVDRARVRLYGDLARKVFRGDLALGGTAGGDRPVLAAGRGGGTVGAARG